MKKLLFTFILAAIGYSSISQIDIGVQNLQVILPSTYLDGDNLPAGDTIEQIQFEVYNYGAADINNGNLPSYQVEFKYNNASRLASYMVVGTIASGSSRTEKMPEYSGGLSQSFLPKFPTGATSLNLCVKTNANGDVDATNDEMCILLTIGNSTSVEQATKKINSFIYYNNQLILQDNTIRSVKVFGVLGNLVKSINSILNAQSIDFSDLKTGIYLLNIEDENNNQQTLKITIQN